MITVAEFMTSDVLALSPQDSLFDAHRLMLDNNIRHVPVVDGEGGLLGLFTDRDLLALSDSALLNETMAERQLREQKIPLADVMKTRLEVVDEHCSLRLAAVRMQKHKYGCLPVVRGRQLVGIITDSDYVAIAINLLEQAEEAESIADDLIDDDI